MPARVFLVLLLAGLTSCSAPREPVAHAPIFYGGIAPIVAPDVRATPPPVIQSIWISGKMFKGGDLVRIRVTASTNVAVVEMRTFSGGRALIKHDFGKFGCAYHVPVLPPFARFPYTITFHFIARDSQGDPVAEDAAINIRG
jgi:hypothetical protein